MRITKDMKVADIFEHYPQTQPVFLRFGFGALANPVLRNIFGRLTSLEAGCRMHGVNAEVFLKSLNEALVSPSAAPASAKTTGLDDPEIQKILQMKTRDLVENHPAVQEVFIKHFGPGCFSCPAFGQEDVAFACSMHNSDPAVFARECRERMAAGAQRPSIVAIHDSDTINELIQRYPIALEVFHKYGVDSCCGGVHSLEKAAAAHNLDLLELKKELLNRIVKAA